MALSTAALNTGLQAIGAAITKVSLHSANPGATGANKLVGGSPAYADKTPTFVNPTVAADLQLSAPLTFDVPAGAVVAYFGLWAGATWYGGAPVAAPESFASQGQYQLAAIDVTGS